MKKKRLGKLRDLLNEKNIDNILILSPENIYYYSGFSDEEAFLFITSDTICLFTDFRYQEQTKTLSEEIDVFIIKDSLEKDFSDFVKKEGTKKVYFEPTISYGSYRKIKDNITGTTLELINDVADIPRIVKDDDEIKLIKKACEISVEAFKKLVPIIKPGIRESELSTELEYLMKQEGAESIAFKTTIASGKRSSLPHGTASEKIIENNNIITFDFGAKYNSYCSDITRTIFLGSCTSEQKKVYEIVYCAQKTALSYIEEGRSNYDVDRIARNIIDKSGYADCFGHGLGHGIGLMIHEEPRLAPRVSKEEKLKNNTVVTVEPAIYIENDFGVRIEDTILVSNNGIDVFTKYEKEIIIL